MTHKIPGHYRKQPPRETITLEQRILASQIIKGLRELYSTYRIAEVIGINPKYLAYAMNMTLADGGHYKCPAEAIRRILQGGWREAMKVVA